MVLVRHRARVAMLWLSVVVLGASCGASGGVARPAGGHRPQAAPASADVRRPTAPTTTAGAGPPTTLPPITPARPGPASVVAAGPATSPGVALTFDDGYCDACVGKLVAAVARTRVHVTFCPNGLYRSVWERYAPFIKVLIARGLVQICNHTLNHKTLTTLSNDQIRYEIQANEDWIEQTFGVSSRPYLRPPGGTYDQRVLDIAGQLGFTTILYWSATLSDSSLQPPQQVIGVAQRCSRPGLVVLGHANYPTTADHFDEIVAAVEAHGLVPETVSELFGPTAGAAGIRPDPRGACA